LNGVTYSTDPTFIRNDSYLQRNPLFFNNRNSAPAKAPGEARSCEESDAVATSCGHHCLGKRIVVVGLDKWRIYLEILLVGPRIAALAHLIAARHSVIIVLLSLIFKTALVDASPYSPLQNLFVRTDMINNTVRNSNLHTVHRNTISQGSDCTISGPFSQHQLVPSSPPDLRLPGEKKMSCRGVLGCCACRVPRSAVQSEQVHSRRSTQTLLNRDGADVR